MQPVIEKPHIKYGSAIIVRPDLNIIYLKLSEELDIEILTIEIQNFIVLHEDTKKTMNMGSSLNYGRKHGNLYWSMTLNFHPHLIADDGRGDTIRI